MQYAERQNTMRKSIKLSLAGLASAGAIVIPASGAFAATGPVAGTTVPNGNSNIVQITGKNGVSYGDPVFGNVHCDEVHHNAKGSAVDFDSVTCQFTDGQVLPAGQVQTVGWNSDFPAGRTFDLNTGTITLTVNTAGTGYAGIATYPNG